MARVLIANPAKNLNRLREIAELVRFRRITEAQNVAVGKQSLHPDVSRAIRVVVQCNEIIARLKPGLANHGDFAGGKLRAVAISGGRKIFGPDQLITALGLEKLA